MLRKKSMVALKKSFFAYLKGKKGDKGEKRDKGDFIQGDKGTDFNKDLIKYKSYD